jgi:hypothetical protein
MENEDQLAEAAKIKMAKSLAAKPKTTTVKAE